MVAVSSRRASADRSVALFDEAARRAGDDRERRAQIVRDGRQQRVAQLLRCHADFGFLRDFDEVDALECERDLRRERIQQAALLGHEDQPFIARRERQHAAIAHRCAQRHIVDGGAGERVGAEPRRLPAIVYPLRDREIDVRQRVCLAGRCDVQRFRAVGQQQRGGCLEHAAHVLHGDLGDLLCGERARQFATHRRQRRGAALAVRRDARLITHAGGEFGDRQRDDQHHGERQQIFRIRHREREVRRHADEIEQTDADDRCRHGRTSARARRDPHDRDQIQHRDVGDVDVIAKEQRDHADDGDRAHGFGVRAPFRAVVAPIGLVERNDRRGLLRGFAADDQQVHRAGVREQGVVRRSPEPTAPRRGAGSAQNDLARVAFARKSDQRGRNVLAGYRRGFGAEFLCEPQRAQDPGALRFRQALQRRRLDVNRDPFGAQTAREAASGADDLFRMRARPDGDQRGAPSIARRA